MVGTKIIDKALSLVTVGSLQKLPWHGDRLTLGQSCWGCCNSPVAAQTNVRWQKGPQAPLLWRCRSSDSMMSKVWFSPHRRSPFWHLAPSMYGPIPVSGDTACEYMSSQSWHLVPSCQPQWYPQLPMGNYILVPQGYQSAGATCAPMLWRYPLKQSLGRFVSANQVPLVVCPTRTAAETKYPVQEGWVLEALDLQGLTECPELEQKQVRELLLKWEQLFAHSDLDLGKTALTKYKIQLTDQMPFKECYRCIPSHMYNNMRAHIQEMLDISAMCWSHSPWASVVVLVQKKDGDQGFCIDLRKLNNWTVKDAYLLPQIEETLDSLQGSQWFSSLDLKSGYWQVEMDEESKYWQHSLWGH